MRQGGRTRTLTAIGLVLGAVAATVFLAEVALRIPAAVSLMSSTWFRPDARFGVRVQADRALPGGGHTNAAGFNDLPSERRDGQEIVFVGDSFTFGTVPAGQAFAHGTAAALGPDIRATNAGIPAVGPREYLAVIEDIAVPARPALVVVTLYLGNDLFQSDPALRTRMYMGEPKSLPDPDRIPRGLDEFYMTRLAALGWRTVTRMVGGCYDHDLVWSDEFLRTVYQQELSVVLSPRAGWYVGRLVDRVVEMRAAMDAAGIPSVFVLAPSELQLNAALRGEVAGCLGWDDTDVVYPPLNADLSRELTQRGIDHLDLTPDLSRMAAGTRLFNRYDTHLNAAGNQAVANILATFLRNRLSRTGQSD